MAELIKRFIVWYLLKRCNAVFEYNGRVVRVFSEEFYNFVVDRKIDHTKHTEYYPMNIAVTEKGERNEKDFV
jgi:hypothetical protein